MKLLLALSTNDKLQFKYYPEFSQYDWFNHAILLEDYFFDDTNYQPEYYVIHSHLRHVFMLSIYIEQQ